MSGKKIDASERGTRKEGQLLTLAKHILLIVVIAIGIMVELNMNVDVRQLMATWPPHNDQLWSAIAAILIVILPHLARATSRSRSRADTVATVVPQFQSCRVDTSSNHLYLTGVSGHLVTMLWVLMFFGSIIVMSNIVAQAGAAGARKAEHARPNGALIFSKKIELSDIEASLKDRPSHRESDALEAIISKKKYNSYKEMQEARAELEIAYATDRLRKKRLELLMQLKRLDDSASQKMSGWARAIRVAFPGAPLHIAEAVEPAIKGLFVAGGAVLVPIVMAGLMFPPPPPPVQSQPLQRQRRGSDVDLWASIALVSGGELEAKEARAAYEDWCKSTSRAPVKPQTFGAHIKRICEDGGATPRRSGNRKWWEGVSLGP